MSCLYRGERGGGVLQPACQYRVFLFNAVVVVVVVIIIAIVIVINGGRVRDVRCP